MSSRIAAGGSDRRAYRAREPIHILGDAAFLDDDFGYYRWKLGFFGAAFIALWLWAAARYRFG